MLLVTRICIAMGTARAGKKFDAVEVVVTRS